MTFEFVGTKKSQPKGSAMKPDLLILVTILVVLCLLPQRIQALNPSPGCGRAMPWPPNPGRRHQFQINYHDQFLGPMQRQYRIQLPNGKCMVKYWLKKDGFSLMFQFSDYSTNNHEPVPMVIDLHGLTGNSKDQQVLCHANSVIKQL